MSIRISKKGEAIGTSKKQTSKAVKK